MMIEPDDVERWDDRDSLVPGPRGIFLSGAVLAGAFRPGLYRHYKGRHYRALFAVVDHETEGVHVVYVPLEYPRSGLRSRPLSEWRQPLETIEGGPRERVTVTQRYRYDWIGA